MAGHESVPADEFRSIKMSWIWIGVVAVILIFGANFTPWETIEFLLADQGVGDQGASLIGFVAGYTFPLTIGIGLIAYLWLTNSWPNVGQQWSFVLVAVILGGAGLVAGVLGLGRLPEYQVEAYRGGPIWAYPAALVMSAYVNSYGWPLVVSSAAVAVAAALHLERLMRSDAGSSG